MKIRREIINLEMKKSGIIHYGWIVLITGTFGVFAALGLARFGYTTVLPAMQSDLGLTNEQTGMLATANLVGYLLFSLIGGLMASRFGARIMICTGLFVTGLGMLLTGASNSFGSLIFFRVLTGIGSGAANISIMGLMASWFSSKKRGTAAGIAVSGSSIAIILTGIAVPWMISKLGEAGWRECWYLYGTASLILSVCSFFIIKNSASDLDLPLIGESETDRNDVNCDQHVTSYKQVYLSRPVWSLGLIYAAFGFSYIIYMTFFVKHLIADHGYSNSSASQLFMMIGWFSLGCGLIWGMISDMIGRKRALIIIFIINSVSFALFSIGTGKAFFVISAVLFGLSAWSVPAVMSALCGDRLGRVLAPAALGFVTLFFGIGQAAAPVAAGAMADQSGSFASSFLAASLVSLFGAVISLILMKKEV